MHYNTEIKTKLNNKTINALDDDDEIQG